MAPMTTYAVSTRVIEVIEKECRLHPDRETGGILMGFTEAGCVTVTHASGPGITWDSSPRHFTKDTHYVQQVLNILNEYSGVNYLGLWHKHPLSHRRPSQPDILNAMDEVADREIGLEEILTPICLLHPNRVEIVPYVVRQGRAEKIEWTQISHESIKAGELSSRQWYRTKGGNDRLISEINGLQDMGVQIEVREVPDGRYQIRVQADNDGAPITEMIFLCPHDYPVGSPSVAIRDKISRQYNPLQSKTVDDWNISKQLKDVLVEYNAAKERDGNT